MKYSAAVFSFLLLGNPAYADKCAFELLAHLEPERSLSSATPVVLSTASFDPTDIQKLTNLLGLMHFRADNTANQISITPDGTMGADTEALNRIAQLAGHLEQKTKTDKNFGAAYGEFVKSTLDLASNRATLDQILTAPEIFANWSPIDFPGTHASRAGSYLGHTILFNDPAQKMFVLYAPPREAQTKPFRTARPAEFQGMQVVSQVQPDGKVTEALNFKKIIGGKEQDVSGCIDCHTIGTGLGPSALTRAKMVGGKRPAGALDGPGSSFYVPLGFFHDQNPLAKSIDPVEALRLMTQ